MTLTAKLAYSQIKISRSRTMWTLIGIVLSTATITAICNFFMSVNAAIVELLGPDYALYGGMSTGMLLVPAVILSGIIIVMSVIVISNAFRVSAGERTRQFGVLKSVGATKQQITATVMYESLFLSAIGIPMGILAGLLITVLAVQTTNYFLGEFNSLTQIMINEVHIVLPFIIAWQALTVAALLSFFTIFVSAWIPARKAAKLAAIESIRGTGDVKVEAKQIRTSPFVPILFGFEGVLAAKNIKRNKRDFRASIVSLSIAVILFVNTIALSEQMSLIEDVMYPDVDGILVDYSSARQYVLNETTGRQEPIIRAPINGQLAEVVFERLRAYENTEIRGRGYDLKITYHYAIVPPEMISAQMKDVLAEKEEQPFNHLSTELIMADKESYVKFCELAGVPIGSGILVNHHNHNADGHSIDFEPFVVEEEAFPIVLPFVKADDSIKEITVHGVLTQEQLSNEFFMPNVGEVRVIVPELDEIPFYTWYAYPEDEEGFIDYANLVMAELFPAEEEANYMQLDFSVNVYRFQDYMKVLNISVALASVFVYSFAVLLALIGLTNVISTMSANVRLRSREFAVLQSVGMTPNGIKRMLNLESVLCSTKSLLIGLPIALILTYLINRPIREMFPIPYQFPLLATLSCTVGIFLLTWLVMQFSASSLRKQNTIETIRSEA